MAMASIALDAQDAAPVQTIPPVATAAAEPGAEQGDASPAQSPSGDRTAAQQRSPLATQAAPPVQPSRPVLQGTVGQTVPAAHIFGDWNGLLPKLQEKGITPLAMYYGQGAANLNEGTSKKVRWAGEFALGATVNLQKLTGSIPGTFRVLFTKRHGQLIGTENGLGVLQSNQDVFGFGNIWRLTQGWYQIAGKTLDLKIGRMSPGEDFDAGRCDFQNLAFCGALIGHLQPDVFQNYPVSQWGVRVKAKPSKDVYVAVGTYNLTDDNRNPHEFDFGFGNSTGVSTMAEIGYTPKLNGVLPGVYKIGMLYSTVNGSDLLLNTQGQRRAAAGGAPLVRHDRVGFWADMRQQILMPNADGSHGLAVTARFAYAPQHVTNLESKAGVMLNYTGVIPGRPDDDLGIGFGRARLNKYLTRSQELANRASAGSVPVRSSEYEIELYYGLQPIPGLVVKPNFQFIVHPAGDPKRKAIGILGLTLVSYL
ncbi:carbohydrate porin [Sphingomonas aracearum]|nr:carbohydrate porin [Sphingomonas aracearum]